MVQNSHLNDQNSTEIVDLIKGELEQLKPYIASHGGVIEFVKFEKSIVFVKLLGTCKECPLSFYTLTYGIERSLKSKISDLIRIEVLE